MSSHILIEQQDRIRTLRINRAEKKNALTSAMYTAMADALESAASDPEVRVTVIAGTEGVFSSGNDVVDFLQLPPMDVAEAPVARFMHNLAQHPKPVVAAVAGPAVGIGTTLLLHCDLVYADGTAMFQMPFVNIGICPEFASTYLLPRLMGHPRAAELLMLGERFDAERAREYGLINAVTANGEAEARAREAALALAAKPPAALRTTKALLKQWSAEKVIHAIDTEARHFLPMLRQPEAVEALTAFTQKRKPDFSRFE